MTPAAGEPPADVGALPPDPPAVRLARSRERIRLALRDIATPQTPSAAGAGAGAPFTAWFDALKSSPGASVLIETVRQWWAQHPLKPAVSVAADGLSAALRPVARRHPIALALGALLLGALLARSRPWRWLLQPALLAALLPQLLPQLFPPTTARAPSVSWWSVLSSLMTSPALNRQAQRPARQR